MLYKLVILNKLIILYSLSYLLPEDTTQNKLVLIEKWQSKDLQQLHLTTPHMQTFSIIKEKYVDDTKVTFLNN